MILSYFIINFMPLMIILGLIAMMYVNRDVKIPATSLFTAVIIMMLLLTVIAMVNTDISIEGMSQGDANRIIFLHTLTSTLSYTLRPCMTMFEILIISHNKKYKFLYTIPAIINGLIFSTALFGSEIAFYIGSDNRWHSGPLRPTIFIVQLFYLIWLVIISIRSFNEKNKHKSIVLIAMCFQAISCAVLEYNGVVPSYTDSITALCILEYYIYLMSEREEISDFSDNQD